MDTSLGTPLSPVHRPAAIQHQNCEVSIYPACRVLHWHGLLCFAALSSAYSRRGLYPQDKYIHSTRQLHSKASSKELQRDIRISPVLKPQGSTPSGALKGLRKPNLKAPSPDGRSMTGQSRVRCQSSCNLIPKRYDKNWHGGLRYILVSPRTSPTDFSPQGRDEKDDSDKVPILRGETDLGSLVRNRGYWT